MKTRLLAIFFVLIFPMTNVFAKSKNSHKDEFILPITNVEKVSLGNAYELVVTVEIRQEDYELSYNHVFAEADLTGPLNTWTMIQGVLWVKYSETDIQLVSTSSYHQTPGAPLKDWFNELGLYGTDFVAKFTLRSGVGTTSQEVDEIAARIRSGELFVVRDTIFGQDFDDGGSD